MGEKLVVDSVPTEGAVLSAVLQDELKEPNNRLNIWQTVSGTLREDHFTDSTFKKIFIAMKSIKIDNPNMDITSEQVAEKAGLSYSDIVDCITRDVSVWNAETYIRKLAEYHIERQIKNTAIDIKSAEGLGELRRQIEDQYRKIGSLGKRSLSMAEQSVELFENLFKGKTGLSTGSRTLDKNLSGGLQKSRMYVIDGQTGGGKSTFALQLADQTAESGKALAIYVVIELSKFAQYDNALSQGLLQIGMKLKLLT